MTDEPNTRLVILCQPSRESPAATRDHSVYLSTSKQLRRVTARADYKTTLTDAGVGEIRERRFQGATRIGFAKPSSSSKT